MLLLKMPEILSIKVKIIIEVMEVAMKYVNLKFLKCILSLLLMKKLNVEEENVKENAKKNRKEKKKILMMMMKWKWKKIFVKKKIILQNKIKLTPNSEKEFQTQ